MTLLDKSVKLALIASAALLTACPEDKTDDTAPADTDTDTDTDSDTDGDTDSDTDVDTGIGALFWLANIETTTDGETYTLTSASLGFGAYGIVDQDWACTVMGTLADEGAAVSPDTCPECEWTFNLGPVTGSVTEGTYCDGFVDTVFGDGVIDTYFDWNWGFATSYNYYGSDGTLYPIEETVFIDSDGSGEWGMFAFNYGTSFQMITGDATSLSVAAQASDGTNNIYYYYYR